MLNNPAYCGPHASTNHFGKARRMMRTVHLISIDGAELVDKPVGDDGAVGDERRIAVQGTFDKFLDDDGPATRIGTGQIKRRGQPLGVDNLCNTAPAETIYRLNKQWKALIVNRDSRGVER